MLKRMHNIFGSFSWTLSGRVLFGPEVRQNSLSCKYCYWWTAVFSSAVSRPLLGFTVTTFKVLFMNWRTTVPWLYREWYIFCSKPVRIMRYCRKLGLATRFRFPARQELLRACIFLYSWFRASWLYINKIQRDATVYRCLFTAKLLYMFRVSIAPIIRSISTVTAAFGTGHSFRATTFRQRGLIRPEYSLMYSWWWVR
jgi:hypothetical protein